ncbi:cystatin [Hoplias malabaricus]|uniref:cystatin n=1 Tax=Hoplias malabaricus TaxID=27720 RepID=UPI00346257B2
MDVSYHLLLVFLLAGLCSFEQWSVNAFVRGPIPGKPQNVSKNDTGVKKAVQTATYTFNNQSNDAYFFKSSSIDDAQKQIVKGIMYLLKVEISRTVCQKRESDVDLAKCAFQPHGLLQQTFLCNFEVWAIPWKNIMKTTFSLCLPSKKH